MRRFVCLLWLLLLTACAGEESPSIDTPTPLPTPRARLAPTAPSDERAIYIALPGLTPDDLDTTNTATTPTLHMLGERFISTPLTPIQPPLPAPSLASLATGALPAEHATINRYLDVGVLATTTLWHMAEEEGRRSAVVGWPHQFDPPMPSIWVAQTAKFSDPVWRTLPLSPTRTLWKDAPPSYTPPQEATLTLQRNGRDVATLFLLALDTLDDETPMFDTVLVDTDRHVGPETAYLSIAHPWGGVLVADKAGIMLKLAALESEQLTLYVSEGVAFDASSPELAEAILFQFGFYPPDADQDAYLQGRLTTNDILFMAERQTTWLANVSAFIWETLQPDLLMSVWPLVQQTEPLFLLTTPEQYAWTEEAAANMQGYRQRALATLDTKLRTLLTHVDLSTTTLTLASPHGYTPTHTQLNLTALLTEWGLLDQTEDGAPDWSRIRATFVYEDGTAWFWPLFGTEDPRTFRATLRSRFNALTDPRTGEAPVALMLSDEALAQTALWRPSTREGLFVQLKPGYRFVLTRSPNIFEPSLVYGAAGYMPETPRMRGWALFAGLRAKQTITLDDERPPRVVDVPATVATLLGLDWPRERHGQPLTAP
nr:alkaline phosphatase family protein [Ardenticatena sp.]